MTNEIRKIEHGTPNAIAVRQHEATASSFEGSDEASLGRCAMYYGTPEEESMYAGVKGLARGVLIDVLEKRALKSTLIVPVHGWEDMCRWDKGSPLPRYIAKPSEYHTIPEEDKAWAEGDKGKSLAPLASLRYHFIVIVQGEPYPYLMTFKRSSLKAGKFIRQYEARRNASKQASPFYALTLVDDKNADGKVYKRMVASFALECDADTKQTVVIARSSIRGVIAQAEVMAAEATPIDAESDVPF